MTFIVKLVLRSLRNSTMFSLATRCLHRRLLMQLLLMNHVAITFASKGLSFNGVDHL